MCYNNVMAQEDKGGQTPGIIERIHDALGLKVLPEQQAEIDRIKREGAEQTAALKKTLDADLERMKRGLEATAAREHREAQAELDRARERVTHPPKHLDTANDPDALKRASMNGEDIVAVRNRTTIYQWDDGRGNIIYLNPDVFMNQIQAVSARITKQQESFRTLGTDEQAKARTEFGSAQDTAATVSPYKDFLKSEALGERFRELKQSRPGPK